MAKLGHVDQVLTDVSVKFNQTEFVHDMLCPEKPVKFGSDKFITYNKRNNFKNPDDTLSKTGGANTLRIGHGTDTYSVDDHGLIGYVNEQDRLNADDPLNPEIDLTEDLTAAILLNREVRCYDKAIADAAAASNTASPSTKWNAGGDPIVEIHVIMDKLFIRPNKIAISRPVWNVLRTHPKVLDKFGGGNAANLLATQNLVRDLLEVEELRVAEARRDTTKANNTENLVRVFGKDIVFAFVNPRDTLKTITWARLYAQMLKSGSTFQVRKWRKEGRGIGGSDAIQVEHSSVIKTVTTELVGTLTDCVD